MPSTVYYFVAQVILRYHERYPRVRVKIFDASGNDVLVAVSGGEADFGLTFVSGLEPDIDFEPLRKERFVAACRRDHPIAKKRSVSWTELAQYDTISMSRASGNRLLLDQALSGLVGRPEAIYEAQQVTAMLGLVEAGLGVAAVPSLAMPAGDHPLPVSVALTDPTVSRKVGLIRRRGRNLSPPAQQLFDLFSEMRKRRGTVTKGNGAAKRATATAPAPDPPSPRTAQGRLRGRTSRQAVRV